MTDTLVELRQHDGVAHIVLNRPEKRNALNMEMLTRLVSLLKQCQDNADVKAIVISGTSRGFAAGADVGTLASASPIGLYTSGFSEKWDEVAMISKPLIAAISNYALGGGLELALICDILVADRTAIFGLPEAAIGVVPGAGGTQRLVRAVGKTMAMEMILAGRRLNADEAKACGLISNVAGDDESVEDLALKIAGQIAKAAPLAVAMAKSAVLESFESPLSTGIRYERSLSALISASDDRNEGLRAFASKETPRFRGR